MPSNISDKNWRRHSSHCHKLHKLIAELVKFCRPGVETNGQTHQQVWVASTSQRCVDCQIHVLHERRQWTTRQQHQVDRRHRCQQLEEMQHTDLMTAHDSKPPSAPEYSWSHSGHHGVVTNQWKDDKKIIISKYMQKSRKSIKWKLQYSG